MSKFAKLFYLEPEHTQVLFYLDWQNNKPGLRCLTNWCQRRIDFFYLIGETGEMKKAAEFIAGINENDARDFFHMAIETYQGQSVSLHVAPEAVQ